LFQAARVKTEQMTGGSRTRSSIEAGKEGRNGEPLPGTCSKAEEEISMPFRAGPSHLPCRRFRAKSLTHVLAIAAVLAGGCRPDAAKAPTGFTPYVGSDKSFACQSPNGWKRSESGANGIMSSVVFTSGTAKVSVTSDLKGSLMADLTRANNAQTENLNGSLPEGMQEQAAAQMPKPVPPVEKLHIAGKKSLEEKIGDYAENAMTPFPCAFGEARLSEFTGDAGMLKGGKTHGYRATILSGDRRVTVVCRCPESDWSTLRPAFSTILQSLAPGGG
jgi:hypothetical protein